MNSCFSWYGKTCHCFRMWILDTWDDTCEQSKYIDLLHFGHGYSLEAYRFFCIMVLWAESLGTNPPVEHTHKCWSSFIIHSSTYPVWGRKLKATIAISYLMNNMHYIKKTQCMYVIYVHSEIMCSSRSIYSFQPCFANKAMAMVKQQHFHTLPHCWTITWT